MKTAITPDAETTAGTRGLMLPYQRGFDADPARIRIWRKGRRIGADYSRAYFHTKRRALRETTLDLNYMSRAERTAREFIRYCAKWCKFFGVVAEAVWREDEFEGIVCRVGQIEFPEHEGHAPIIRAISGHDDAFRGFDGDWILSEFAFYDRPWAVMDSAAGTSLLGGRGEILTTVNMEGDPFEQLCDEARRVASGNARPGDRTMLSLHTTTFDDAARGGLCAAINRDRGLSYTPEQLIEEAEGLYRNAGIRDRELRCKASREAGSFFPWHELEACKDDALPSPIWLERPESESAHAFDPKWSGRGAESVSRLIATARAHAGDSSKITVGIDIGRTKDRFVIAVLAWTGDRARLVGMLCWRGMKFAPMQDAGDAVMRSALRPLRGCGDAQGIGMQMCEHWQDTHRGRFEAIPSTNATKEDMATRGSSFVQSVRLALPDSHDVLNAFNRIRETRTDTGKRRYDVDANRKGAAAKSGDPDAGAEGHADEFWATMEALLAGENAPAHFKAGRAYGGLL